MKSIALFLSLVGILHGFLHGPTVRFQQPRTHLPLAAFSVSVEELEKDLTPSERSITSVVRKSEPSVAFVTSVAPQPTRRQRKQAIQDKYSLPKGQPLGSGSGFLIASGGYLCTNFHVIERAWSMQQTYLSVENAIDNVAANITSVFNVDVLNSTKSTLKALSSIPEMPQIFVRINSGSKLLKCRIVGVEPDKDLAVLQVDEKDENDTDLQRTVSFGSSSDLIVGQSVVAIGNPFGLEKSVTAGIVSAVNREFNAGGPLLNLKGDVVGINTAIITTSGSNAGIGFAVPADQLKPIVDRLILDDRVNQGERPNKGFLGIEVLRQPTFMNSNSTKTIQRNWVTSVTPKSPAEEAGVRPIRITDNGIVKWGDAIVAVGGNSVTSLEELHEALGQSVAGEQLSLTLEDREGERRVVYVKLAAQPMV